jgi:ankyrin repeat protein
MKNSATFLFYVVWLVLEATTAGAQSSLEQLRLELGKSQIIANELQAIEKIENTTLDRALHDALLMRDFDEARRLIDKGIKVNSGDEFGATPLHRTVSQEAPDDLLRLLLERGAEVDAVDNGGRTALHRAALTNNTGHIPILLAAGATLDASDNEAETPLMSACERGHLAVAQLLFEAGANINAVSRSGVTPLHYAVASGGWRKDGDRTHVELVQWLMANGADPQAAYRG